MNIRRILSFFGRSEPSVEPAALPARSLDVLVKVDDTPFTDLPTKPQHPLAVNDTACSKPRR